METPVIVEDPSTAIPSCTLGGRHWYSEAHFLRLTEDHLTPVKPERVLVVPRWKKKDVGAGVVLALLYRPKTGIPFLDGALWQAAMHLTTGVAEPGRSSVEVPAMLRFAYPDEVLIYMGVEDLRRRTAAHVKAENQKFVEAAKDLPANPEWVRQHTGVCLWAARAIISHQKTLASISPRE